MPEFLTVSSVDDFRPGVARTFEVDGRTVAVARVGESWYAFDDACTHKECSLAEGEIEGESVVCPCHDGTFDLRTGRVLGGPPPAPIRTYPVQVAGGEVRVARPREAPAVTRR